MSPLTQGLNYRSACDNRATVSALCLVVLLITFHISHVLCSVDLFEQIKCMYVCMYVL